MDVKINDYYEPAHFKALNEANYDVSHSCEYEQNEMHHIHNVINLKAEDIYSEMD